MPTRLAAARREETGVTLVELLVAMGLTALLLVTTIPVVETFFSVDSSVTQTVTQVNRILPATTTLERYLRSAVEPGPASGGVPVPPFAPASTPVTSSTTFDLSGWDLTFYANVGNSTGPVKVTATLAGPDASGLYTLEVSDQTATSGSCPGSPPPLTSTGGATCSFTTTSKPIATIPDVLNGPSSGTPIFTYSVAANGDGTPAFESTTTPPTWTCTATGCPPDQVTAIGIHLRTQAHLASLTSIDTVVYLFAPFYSTNVG